MKNIRRIVFCVILQYCLAIGYAADEAGCFHNGTMFAEGSLVPSMETCLSCKCFSKNLICSLRICAEQPIPPPRGCVLVHKQSSCCPHLLCRKYHNQNENENRRVITYSNHWYHDNADLTEDGQQKAISKNSVYRRLDDGEFDGNDEMCVHNGTIYGTGSAMSTSSICSYCYCIGGKQKCIRPKCLLASPGCEPIFIDSTCCPIRYNCDVLGKSSNTNYHLHHIDNKHYNRMRSRAQRNRGCLVGSYYYPEGEKLPTDPSKPCEICFCIRGERKCTPQKCAPYISSCKPKIPVGQCCPSNYECDHSTNVAPRSIHSSRQFSLFSYFFGDESTANETDKDVKPSLSPQHNSASASSEASLFDAIREGLNYIDSNDEDVEKILETSSVNSLSERPLPSNTSEFSFLDIFLGEGDDDEIGDDFFLRNNTSVNSPLKNLSQPEDDVTSYLQSEHSSLHDSSTDFDRYALLDEHNPVYDTTPSVYDFGDTEKVANEFSTFPYPTDVYASTIQETEEYTELRTESQVSFSHDVNASTEKITDNLSSNANMISLNEDKSSSTDRFAEGNTSTDISHSSHNQATEMNATIAFDTNSTIPDEVSNRFDSSISTKKVDVTTNPSVSSTTPLPSTTESKTKVSITKLSTTIPQIPITTRKVSSTITSTSAYAIEISSTHSSSMPFTTTNTTSLSSILPTTTSPPITSVTPKSTHTTVTEQHHTSPKIALTTTDQPNKLTVIDSNPSILESDQSADYDYGEPTLPPSLPNLKIIPFLPADAVQKEVINEKSNFEYYPTSFPVLTENYENRFLTSDNQNANFLKSDAPNAVFHHNNDNPDFSTYSIESMEYSKKPIYGLPKTNLKSSDYDVYGQITEDHSQLDTKKPNKYPIYTKYGADYEYDSFEPGTIQDTDTYIPSSYDVIAGQEYSSQGRNPSFDSTNFPERHVYGKIEFSTSNPIFGFNGVNKFSPPIKTEGGFVPKEPMQNDQYYDAFHSTKVANITTENSLKAQENLSGLLIGITSEDPFKDVIRTEPPPDLLTLIEDKEKLFQKTPDLLGANIDHDYPSIHLSDVEKEIISITTDSNENFTVDAHEFVTKNFSNNSSEISLRTSNVTELTNVTEITPSTNTEPSSKPEANDFLGSLLGYIFKGNKNVGAPKPTEGTPISEKSTIPPFKKISSTSLTLMDILNFTKPAENSSNKSDNPQRINDKIYEYPTTPSVSEQTQAPQVETLLKEVLLATLNIPFNNDPSKHVANHPTIDVPKQIYSTHSIHQFRNPIFSGISDFSHDTNKYTSSGSGIDLSLPNLNSQFDNSRDELINNVFEPENYQVLKDYPKISNNENSFDFDSLQQHHSESSSSNVYKKPLNSFPNSMGILKLAGCNIYGRMYRVGRIITELSNACSECKCTEVGVHCTPLNC